MIFCGQAALDAVKNLAMGLKANKSLRRGDAEMPRLWNSNA
jgi:hypothetical protein